MKGVDPELPPAKGAGRGTALSMVPSSLHQGHNWIQGPDLMQARRIHAAGVVTDEVTTEKLVIVTGGEHNGIILDSTEMLFNNQWHQGKMTHYHSSFV